MNYYCVFQKLPLATVCKIAVGQFRILGKGQLCEHRIPILESGTKTCKSLPNPYKSLQILAKSLQNPCKSSQILEASTESLKKPCRSLPIFSNPCESLQILANPGESSQILADPCQSLQILSVGLGNLSLSSDNRPPSHKAASLAACTKRLNEKINVYQGNSLLLCFGPRTILLLH